MHLTECMKGEVAVLQLKGDLIYDDDEAVLQEKINSLTADGITKVVLDLSNVTRINSRGLSALINAMKRLRSLGGDIRFAQIDKHLTNIFVKTRLIRVFSAYQTVDRALASYVS